jgi:hypothetical protein
MNQSKKKAVKKMGKRIIESITGDQLATLLDLVCRPPVLLSVLKDMKRIDADLA